MSLKNKTINRELSWLSFNERVLQEATDPKVPVVERMRFLAIFSNNQDEFFKVRVASLRRMIDLGYGPKQLDGDNPKKVLASIQDKVIQLQGKFLQAFDTIIHDLEKENIFLIFKRELTNLYVLK